MTFSVFFLTLSYMFTNMKLSFKDVRFGT